MLRRMRRTPARAIGAADRDRGALTKAKTAAARVKEALETGMDSGVFSPARTVVLEALEALAISLAALKAKSEDHKQERERAQHALAVGMSRGAALSKFIEEDDGSLEKRAEYSASTLRDAQNNCIADFGLLDAESMDPYSAAPALKVEGGDLDYVCVIYDALDGQQDDLFVSLSGIIIKPALDEDREEIGCEDGPALAKCIARLQRTSTIADRLLRKQANSIRAAFVAIEDASVAAAAASAAEAQHTSPNGPDSRPMS